MKDLAFSEQEYHRRINLVCDRAKERKIDYLLITEPSHICWLSGFDPSGLFYKNQLHIDVKSGDAAVLTHRAEEKMAAMSSWIDRLLIWHHGSNPMIVAVNHANEYLAGDSEKVVGMNLQTPYFPIADYYAIRGGLGNVGVVDVTKMIDDARMRKSEAELLVVRQAAEWAGEALKAAYAVIKPGVREKDINAAIQEKIASSGSEYPAFPTLVSSGPRTGLFHSLPGERVIEAGDPVMIEIMGVYKRYHASVVRTVFAGKASQEARKIYKLVLNAYEAGLSAIKHGNPVGDIDKATCEVRKGYEDYIPARTGFGVELGYPPSPMGNLSILQGEPYVLEPGLSFTMEPSISGYNDWTIIIGNCVVITENGYDLLFDQNVSL
ncbi:MAG: aminopeptidase P family protein, partial [Desulfobulbaceae bacterium]|nr:aminopeptidase P family protein [Desulfobulbaceae bacterium]